MNAQSIQTRLTIWYTALIVLAAVGFGTYTYLSLQHSLFDEIQTMLGRRIVHLREDVLPIVAEATPDAMASKIEEIYSPEENDRFIRISKADGTILFRSGTPREQSFDPTLIPMPHDYTDKASEPLKGLRQDQHILLIGLTADSGGNKYILEMGTAITPVEIALHKLILTLLLSLPVIVLIAASGGSLLVRHALRPVVEMQATAEQISFGKLRQRLPVTKSGDAIDQLAITLNKMLDRLDQAYQQASRFSADASHEIRTPLTIMRSEMEAILGEQSMPQNVRERIGSVLEEGERLSAIVESLFSLARLDAGEAKIKNDPCDLSELLRSTLDQMQLLADEKNISVTIDAKQPASVMGDAARLRQIIVNLLDNAIKYTMPGGSVSIATKMAGSSVSLIVRDNGVGIPPDALPHIFERFYRADKVRSRTTIQGAGLGLSIVQAICHAHGGSIDASSQEGISTTLTVTLPLAHPLS
jgi:heavy metal sensor kinase